MISVIVGVISITYPPASPYRLWQSSLRYVITFTPSQFFDDSIENPALLQSAIDELRKLNDDDMMLIIGHIRRLTKE